MCGGAPSMPEMPPAPPTPPPPPPAPEPAAPLPPPTAVSAGDKDAPQVTKRTSKRGAMQQASQGTNALRIALNPAAGAAAVPGADGKPKGNLNIPKA